MGQKPKTPEAEVTDACVPYAELQGWRMYRNHQGIGNKKGRPDWEAVKPFKGLGITIYIEFKGPKGKLSDKQKEYQRELIGQKCIVITARSFDEFRLDLQNVEKMIRERLAT